MTQSMTGDNKQVMKDNTTGNDNSQQVITDIQVLTRGNREGSSRLGDEGRAAQVAN